MHISGKIMIPVGIVMLLLGAGIAISAISIFEEAENIEDLMTEPSSEITKKFTDDDGEGSAGWFIMIQGDGYFVDDNENGILDACEGLNLIVTDSQGNNVTNSTGNVYCELDGELERSMSELDDEHVDPNDEWIIVGIFCDTLDDAGMNGHWETSRNNKGEEGEIWVETGENDRCKIGEEYTFNFHHSDENSNLSTPDMVLFDRDAQGLLEVEGFLTLCGGLCCACLALIFTIIGAISGFAMKPSNSDVMNVQFAGGGVSPVPITGTGTTNTVPGTAAPSAFGAGPARVEKVTETVADEPVPVLDLSGALSDSE
jgi:hypothetical protein